MRHIILAIRILITLFILHKIGQTSSPWVTLGFYLVFMACEAAAIFMQITLKRIENIERRL